ncbi:MAG: glucosamine-6-phosphate deaminase [Pirellulales bacterium]|nr:glucosamine-6-phosphate deaminase [Pirellulales bacterium]
MLENQSMLKEMKLAKPTVIVCADAAAAARRVADLFADQIRSSPQSVLGLATGGTPVEAYRELIRMHREEGLDFSQVATFNLDEYVGLAPDHPQSYRYFMQQQLFDHINVDPQRTQVPDGLAGDLDTDAHRYEQQIQTAGGIDLQLLGIGHNGHIAFNEPGAPLDSRTRVVQLAEQTIEKNSRFFDSPADVPRTALTMGIQTILAAKRIVLLATGEAKAAAVCRAIEGEADPSHPASLLQHHPRVTYVLDEAAAARLTSSA